MVKFCSSWWRNTAVQKHFLYIGNIVFKIEYTPVHKEKNEVVLWLLKILQKIWSNKQFCFIDHCTNDEMFLPPSQIMLENMKIKFELLIIITLYIHIKHTKLFKISLVKFLIVFSYVHQCCIHLIKNTVKQSYYEILQFYYYIWFYTILWSSCSLSAAGY